jgi:hypothetical protein
MKNGIFIQTERGLQVESGGTQYPICDTDLKHLEWYPVLPGDTVFFDLVDEFSHPELFTHIGWGDGVTCAKLNLEKYE